MNVVACLLALLAVTAALFGALRYAAYEPPLRPIVMVQAPRMDELRECVDSACSDARSVAVVVQGLDDDTPNLRVIHGGG